MSLFLLSVSPYQPFILIFLLTIMAISVQQRKLTFPAALTAVIIGFLVLKTAQLKGVSMLMTFFLISVIATSHKKELKSKLSNDHLKNPARNTGQVLANGGVAGLAALSVIIDPSHIQLYLLMMAASMASALADTLSSELGMVYGSRFYNILTFKREANGLDGVISLEGLLIGSAGSAIIAIIYAGFSIPGLIVFVAGILGNLTDSILGAALERKHYLGNNAVNFLNTLTAAIFAGLIFYLI